MKLFEHIDGNNFKLREGQERDIKTITNDPKNKLQVLQWMAADAHFKNAEEAINFGYKAGKFIKKIKFEIDEFYRSLNKTE